MTRDERCIVGQEEGDHRRDFFRAPEAPQLVVLDHVGQRRFQARRLKDAHGHRRGDEARTDGVDTDAAARVVDGHVLGEQDDAALGHAVGTPTRRSLQALDAGDRDHRATLTVHRRLVQHLGENVLGGQERSRQVHAQDALPLVSGQEMDRPSSGHAGRCHQAGDTASELHGGPHEMLDRSFVGDVGVRERPRAVAGPVPLGSAAGSFRSAPMTKAPSPRRRTAVAQPMPDAAPVTM